MTISCLMQNRRFDRPGVLATKLAIFLMLLAENILCWSCRGAGSNEFACELKEIMKEQKPLITNLLEPRISGGVADGVCKRLGKSSSCL